MLTELKNKIKNQSSSYAYSRETVPFPELSAEKSKPPSADLPDNSKALARKELSPEEQAIEYMSTYKKFERVIVCNFYTGGGIYTRGILDSIYRGFNPLNP